MECWHGYTHISYVTRDTRCTEKEKGTHKSMTEGHTGFCLRYFAAYWRWNFEFSRKLPAIMLELVLIAINSLLSSERGEK